MVSVMDYSVRDLDVTVLEGKVSGSFWYRNLELCAFELSDSKGVRVPSQKIETPVMEKLVDNIYQQLVMKTQSSEKQGLINIIAPVYGVTFKLEVILKHLVSMTLLEEAVNEDHIETPAHAYFVSYLVVRDKNKVIKNIEGDTCLDLTCSNIGFASMQMPISEDFYEFISKNKQEIRTKAGVPESNEAVITGIVLSSNEPLKGYYSFGDFSLETYFDYLDYVEL